MEKKPSEVEVASSGNFDEVEVYNFRDDLLVFDSNNDGDGDPDILHACGKCGKCVKTCKGGLEESKYNIILSHLENNPKKLSEIRRRWDGDAGTPI